MALGLSHTGLSVKDMAKSLEFYTGLFQARIIMKIEEPKGTPWIEMLRFPDGSLLELFYPRPEQFPLGDKLGRAHLAFKVDDIHSFHELLEKNSVSGLTDIKTARDGNFQMWCEDPNGYRIEIMEYVPGCPQLSDGPCVTLY